MAAPAPGGGGQQPPGAPPSNLTSLPAGAPGSGLTAAVIARHGRLQQQMGVPQQQHIGGGQPRQVRLGPGGAGGGGGMPPQGAGAGGAGPQTVQMQVRFAHRRGALGAGNDVERRTMTLQEAMVHCATLPGAVGFTFFGPPNPGPTQRVEVFFKASLDGDDHPEWQTFIRAAPAALTPAQQQQLQRATGTLTPAEQRQLQNRAFAGGATMRREAPAEALAAGPRPAQPADGAVLQRFVDAVAKNSRDEALAMLHEHSHRVDAQGRHPLVMARLGNGWLPLSIAAWHGHTDMLEVLLRAGAPINAKMQHGETAVYMAAQHGELEAVKMMLEHRADPLLANAKGADALCVAVEQGHEPIVRFLIEDVGMSAHTKLTCGSSTLWLAAKGGYASIIKYLLGNGAEITANADGQTPYHAAAQRGHHEAVGLLLEKAAADPERQGRVQAAANQSAAAEDTAKTAADAASKQIATAQQQLPDKLQRMAAARAACKAAAAALAAAEREADAARGEVLGVVHQVEFDKRRENAFSDVVHGSAQLANAGEQARQVTAQRVFEGERLEQAIGQTVQSHMTALEKSSQHISEKAARESSAAAAAARRADHPVGLQVAEVDAVSTRGETPLFVACMFAFDIPKDSSKESVLGVLNEKELAALLNQVGKVSNHALRSINKEGLLARAMSLDLSEEEIRKLRDVTALRSAQLKTAEALLAAGADPNVITTTGHSALFVACQRGAIDVARALLAAGADTAIRPPPAELTLLYITCFNGHLPIVKMLCEEAAAEPNDLTGLNRFTALMPAAQEGHLAVIEYLYSRGADATHINSSGNTALYFAAKFNRVEVIKYMMQVMGAHPDLRGVQADTPLYAAAQKGFSEMAEVLIEHKADVNITNENGATPLLTAAEEGHVHMVQLLSDHGADMTAQLKCQSNIVMIAATHGRAKLLRHLIENFPAADPLKPNARGTSPLHEASRRGHSDVVRVLLEGTAADPLQMDLERRTSLKVAVLGNHMEVADALLTHAAADVYRAMNSAARTKSASARVDQGGDEAAADFDPFLPRTGSLAAEAEELLREPEPEAVASSPPIEESVVVRKMRWLRGAIDAFAPERPRVVLTSARANILSTLPQSGFLTLDIRSGLDVAFAGSPNRGDGMRREWLELVSAEFMDPNVNLFRSRDGGRTFDPSPTGSLTNPDHLTHLKVVGRIVGIAFLHGECMRHALFSEAMLGQILDLPLTPAGIEAVDPVLYTNKIKPILAMSADTDPDEAELYLDGLTFTVTTDPDTSACYFGERTTHELCPDGHNREVTLANKDEYIELLSSWYQRTETAPEADAMLAGVRDVLHPSVLQTMKKVITAEELGIIIAGRETFDVEDWRKHTVFRGFEQGALQPQWLQELLEDAEPKFRQGFLRYATGSTNVPMGGFGAINPPLTVQARPDLSPELWPTSSTCVNMLNLPVYPTKAQLKRALESAIEQAGM